MERRDPSLTVLLNFRKTASFRNSDKPADLAGVRQEATVRDLSAKIGMSQANFLIAVIQKWPRAIEIITNYGLSPQIVGADTHV